MPVQGRNDNKDKKDKENLFQQEYHLKICMKGSLPEDWRIRCSHTGLFGSTGFTGEQSWLKLKTSQPVTKKKNKKKLPVADFGRFSFMSFSNQNQDPLIAGAYTIFKKKVSFLKKHPIRIETQAMFQRIQSFSILEL